MKPPALALAPSPAASTASSAGRSSPVLPSSSKADARSSSAIELRATPSAAAAASSSTASAATKWLPAWLRGGSSSSNSGSSSSSIKPASSPALIRSRSSTLSTGDPVLDRFKADLDLMVAEVADVKTRLSDFARTIVGMADQATQTACAARQLVVSSSEDAPASILGFADAHEEWCASAKTLFEDEFHLEVLEPLEMWQEECEQFLRELARTVEARSKQSEYKTRVDELFLALAEAQERVDHAADSSDPAAAAAESLATDLEFKLKIAKTDLGQACTNYSERCAGLTRHFSEICSGRMQALDVACTRFMTQQHFFFRPGLRVIDQELYDASSASGGDFEAQSPAASGSGSSLNIPSALPASMISPRARHRMNSIVGLGGSGLMLPGGLFGPPQLRSRKSTSSALEDDIIRQSRRINRKNYQSQTHHYHAGLNVSSPSHATDLHPSLAHNASRLVLSEQQHRTFPGRGVKAGREQAILDACRQLQSEMDSRRSTEEANEKLRKQVEQLTARAGEAGGGAAGPSAEDAKLKEEIEELRRKLAERESSVEKAKPDLAAELAAKQKAEEDNKPVTGSSAPAAPPLDAPGPPQAPGAPNAPPGPPMPPGPPGAPGAPKRTVVSAREKEREEARRYGLPLLPAVDPHVLNAPGCTDARQRVVLKKLHWKECAASEFMAEDAGDNLWKDLFTRAAAGTKPNDATAEGENRDDPERAALAELVVPLVPRSQLHVDSDEKHDADTAVVAVSKPAAADDNSFAWRWEVDAPAFASLFAQKATVAFAKKKHTKHKHKPNKYALGRKGLKEAEAARIAAGGSPRDEAEQDSDSASSDSSSSSDGEDGDDDEKHDGDSPSASASKRKPKAAKVLPRVELIDAKRSYNVSISLSHFRASLPNPAVIRDAIMSLEGEGATGVLAGETLEILAEILPSVEESQLVANWVAANAGTGSDVEVSAAVARLGSVEQFFFAMSGPGVRDRLKLMLCLSSFNSVSSRIEDLLDLVERGLGALDGARAELGIVCSIVLRLGNLMNASPMTLVPANTAIAAPPAAPGSKAATAVAVTPVQAVKQSYGFSIASTLTKLRGVKSLDNTQTLLHFLVRYVTEHVRPPIHTRLLQDLACLRECARVEQGFLLAEVKQLHQNLSLARAMIEEDEAECARIAREQAGASPSPPPPPPPIDPSSPASVASPSSSVLPDLAVVPSNSSKYIPLPPRVREFVVYATARLAAFDAQISSLRSTLQRLLQYYLLPDRDTTPWESFFSLWAGFLTEWAEVAEEIEERKQQEEKRARQIAGAAALKARREEGARVKAAAAAATAAATATTASPDLTAISSDEIAPAAAPASATAATSASVPAPASTPTPTPLHSGSHSSAAQQLPDSTPPPSARSSSAASSTVSEKPSEKEKSSSGGFARSLLSFISPSTSHSHGHGHASGAPKSRVVTPHSDPHASPSVPRGDFTSMGNADFNSPPPPAAGK